MSLILSLDRVSYNKAQEVIYKISNYLKYIKIGHISFSIFGESSLMELVSAYPLLLDFKLYDIPNTVAESLKGYKRRYPNIKLATIWALGSEFMIKGALDSCAGVEILGVISLTSDVLDRDNFKKEVSRAMGYGLDSFICPATMLGDLRKEFGNDIKLYCPGIRFADGGKEDQREVLDPDGALSLGATCIIMGRPILNSEDPVSLLQSVRGLN